jgi:hypothetical protein
MLGYCGGCVQTLKTMKKMNIFCGFVVACSRSKQFVDHIAKVGWVDNQILCEIEHLAMSE